MLAINRTTVRAWSQVMKSSDLPRPTLAITDILLMSEGKRLRSAIGSTSDFGKSCSIGPADSGRSDARSPSGDVNLARYRPQPFELRGTVGRFADPHHVRWHRNQRPGFWQMIRR